MTYKPYAPEFTATEQTELAKSLARAIGVDYDALPPDRRGYWLFEAKQWRDSIFERAGH